MDAALGSITKIINDNQAGFVAITVASVGITFLGKLIRRAFR